MFKLVLGYEADKLQVEVCELVFALRLLALLVVVNTQKLEKPSLHDVNSHRLQVSPNLYIKTAAH